ncbi:MAG: T9SS type A sorting domain-containing protein [Lentimicrobiaceae bacterium]|jgi:hypothetical protein
MKYKRLQLMALLLLFLGLTGLQAQDAIPATGGNASGSGGSVSYSVGQMVYTSISGTNGLMAQGVQQPFEISLVTGIEEAKGINLIVTAYPNPTTDFLYLKVDASAQLKIQNLSYQLYDISGKLLENKKLESLHTYVDMSHLVLATYFLEVTQGKKELITFKIVKN